MNPVSFFSFQDGREGEKMRISVNERSASGLTRVQKSAIEINPAKLVEFAYCVTRGSTAYRAE